MSKSRETYNKKEVRKKKEKKKKAKAQKREEKREQDNKHSPDDMIAYVDKDGIIHDTPPEQEEQDNIERENIEVSIPKENPSKKQNDIKQGKVTYFNENKGFGFIEASGKRERIFFHINDVREDIQEGDTVEFIGEKGQRGPVAKEVRQQQSNGES